ncbi:hypothetical protein BDZ91DRAFT_769150 [Kalaharituber pfeilii]|nr:hypothetical protein BDZ91DRAFT_769150 [Kalaharituber pfeilii]
MLGFLLTVGRSLSLLLKALRWLLLSWMRLLLLIPLFKELLTFSVALPVVHNNYGPVITLMAGLGLSSALISIVLSDEDVEIFCESMRDVEGLGVDLRLSRNERVVFGLGSSEAGPSNWNQPEDESNKENGYFVPSEEDIPPNFAWILVGDSALDTYCKDFAANVYKVPSSTQQPDICCNLLFLVDVLFLLVLM